MKIRIGNYILNAPGGRIANKADDKDITQAVSLKKIPKTKWPKLRMEMLK